MRSSILEHTFPVSLTTDQITINQDLKALIPKEDIDSEYLLYSLLRYEKQILRKCSKEGTTVASLDSEPLYDFKLPMPSLERQQEIVDRIENIDKRIERVKTNVESHDDIFDDLPKSVLAEAFKGDLVDFEPEEFSEEEEHGSEDLSVSGNERDEVSDRSFDGEGQQSLDQITGGNK
jgi:type I restriction enzyme S subunit